ncbi:hypothetical protein BGW41_007872 [Actinomortierella wolfii]|nr:hypothetical protein BGW41_007872 [Actinomortierella wolfii]
MVAAKKFHVSTSEAAKTAIQREIKALERLSYQHIIRFYGTVYHRGQLVVLTELAEGGSLSLAIQKGIKDWSTKERFAREMMLGLAFIHSKGVLHLDLKSENVLLSSSMEVKLCDFGCATIKTASATRSTDRARGTIRWTAPEIFVRNPKYSTKSDMYSLGMVMWEMAADCTRPFKDQKEEVVVIALVKDGEREELPEETPIKYRAWVERCWHRDPSKRPEANEYFQEAEGAGEDEKRGDEDNLDTNNNNNTTESQDLKLSSVLALMDYVQDIGSGISSDRLMGTIDGSTLHSIPSIDYMKQPVAASRLQSITNTGEQDSHNHASSQSNTSQTVSVEETDHIHHLSSGLDTLPTLLPSNEVDVGRQGITHSSMKAFEWYTKSAEQGNADAQYNLGLMYKNGQGVEQNDVKAVEWFAKSANQGNADAQYNLGMMYRDGRGVGQNDVIAVEWYAKAAHQGNPYSQFKLGWMYGNGHGVEQDDVRAVEWYTKAAHQGNPEGQAHLGWVYSEGRGVERNDVKAVEWYTKAAHQGNADAQRNLGWMYSEGRGVEQDDVKAVEWYTKAAHQGNALAQCTLGWIYSEGRGVEQDDVKAVEWYTKAAHQGHALAQRNLERMYSEGRGVEKKVT